MLITLLHATEQGATDYDASGHAMFEQLAMAGESVDGRFELSQNYPDPFTDRTDIVFSLADASPVGIRVYDILRRVVLQIVDRDLAAGTYRLTIDASDLPSGMYVYRMETSGGTQSRLLSIVR